jgi:RNA polymerase sigma-70 factor (ECF subfamily)
MSTTASPVDGEGVLRDARLMAQVVAGNTGALEVLYDRYAPAVMGLALKMLGDRAAAEEIVQETFWRVWSNAASFETQRGPFAGWLFGIARNLTIDLCRRRKVRPQPVLTEEELERVERAPDPGADVAESAWAMIRHASVRAALMALPPEQRRVIELAYFRGMTRQEIAKLTGEPLGTVHTRARLALRKLREALLAQGYED